MLGPVEYGAIAGIVAVSHGAFQLAAKAIERRNGNGQMTDLLVVMRKLNERMLVSQERWDSFMRDFRSHTDEMRDSCNHCGRDRK